MDLHPFVRFLRSALPLLLAWSLLATPALSRAAFDPNYRVLSDGQTSLPSTQLRQTNLITSPGDGVTEYFALLLNASDLGRYWVEISFLYSTLFYDYPYTADTIYMLDSSGADFSGYIPNGTNVRPATPAELHAVINELAEKMDGDDQLFVWIAGGVIGYYGQPGGPNYGSLLSHASVDPGDEMDYLEHDFKIRSLFMDTQIVYYTDYSTSVFPNMNYIVLHRRMYVSYFTDIFFELLGVRSDTDPFIETLIDYPLGDTDHSGAIDFDKGELIDYDGDGIPAYNPLTHTCDEDEWGSYDRYYDGQYTLGTNVPGGPYALFDGGFDGHLDIDLGYHGGPPIADGTDLDSDGLFDGLDINEDGDQEDWVSIDEELWLGPAYLTDDEIADMLNSIGAGAISVLVESNFSGGFIDDLSAPNRVIMTSSEEIPPFANQSPFANLFTGALHQFSISGSPINADTDENGRISMLEAFDYAAENDHAGELPQYDDNGDAIGHPFPVPSGGDGDFGASVFISPLSTGLISIDIRPNTYVNTIDRGSFKEVPVVLLSAGGFDATSQVDRATLTFGHSGNENSLVWRKPVSVPSCAAGDVNGDGRPDLVCSFSIPKTGLVCGDTRGKLEGRTTSGLAFFGQDNVVIVPCP